MVQQQATTGGGYVVITYVKPVNALRPFGMVPDRALLVIARRLNSTHEVVRPWLTNGAREVIFPRRSLHH